jgi:hypothetical protein
LNSNHHCNCVASFGKEEGCGDVGGALASKVSFEFQNLREFCKFW